MMKSYKDFEKEFIGDSDIATLIMLGYDSKEKDGLLLKKIEFWRGWKLSGIYCRGTG